MDLCNNRNSLRVGHVGLQGVGAVGTSNLHPEQLVLEGDDITGTKLDLGDFKNCGKKIETSHRACVWQATGSLLPSQNVHTRVSTSRCTESLQKSEK